MDCDYVNFDAFKHLGDFISFEDNSHSAFTWCTVYMTIHKRLNRLRQRSAMTSQVLHPPFS